MEPFIESNVTDIEITPDGRLFIFGASREVMDLLNRIGIGGPEARRRLLASRADHATQLTRQTHSHQTHD